MPGRLPALVGHQHPHVRLGGESVRRPLARERRGHDHLHEPAFQHRLRQRAVERPVERDDPAERRRGIGAVRTLVGLARRPCDRRPARVRVLDDDAGRPAAERPDALEGRVRVGDVVERERLALDEAGPRHRGAGGRRIPGVAVEGGGLVGVLPVAQLRQPHELAGPDGGEAAPLHRMAARVDHRSEVVGDGRVVPRGVGERLRGEREAGLRRERPGAPPHLLDDPRVVVPVRHRGDGGMVLGRGPQQGGPPDVDVLHRLAEPAVRALDRPFEGIQVDGEQVDRLDSLRAHDLVVDTTPPQQAAVDARMEGLDPPGHDLRKAGERRDLGDREPGPGEEAGGAPGRYDLDPEPVQRPREPLDPVLVRDAEQRPADHRLSRHRRPSAAAPAGRGRGRGASSAACRG